MPDFRIAVSKAGDEIASIDFSLLYFTLIILPSVLGFGAGVSAA